MLKTGHEKDRGKNQFTLYHLSIYPKICNCEKGSVKDLYLPLLPL